jgi:hypothetical protein
MPADYSPNLDDATLEKYNVDKSELDNIYEHYKLYSRMLLHNRKMNRDKQEIMKKQKDTFYCSLCDKYVRTAIRWHHEKTMKHSQLSEELKKMTISINHEE